MQRGDGGGLAFRDCSAGEGIGERARFVSVALRPARDGYETGLSAGGAFPGLLAMGAQRAGSGRQVWHVDFDLMVREKGVHGGGDRKRAFGRGAQWDATVLGFPGWG